MPSSALMALAAAVLVLPEQPERVLEVGCGDGERVLFLAREYPSARVRGVDADEEAVRRAVSRIGLDPEGRVAFKVGDGRTLPYPDDFFDLVTQAGGRLRPGEIARALRADGHLILIGEWRLLDWRLGREGFEPGESGEADGKPFSIWCLRERGLGDGE